MAEVTIYRAEVETRCPKCGSRNLARASFTVPHRLLAEIPEGFVGPEMERALDKLPCPVCRTPVERVGRLGEVRALEMTEADLQGYLHGDPLVEGRLQ